MTELDYSHAILLGLIQAITEFLPISSSGHLALTQRLLRFNANSPQMLLFDVATHVGTLVAVLLVFRCQIARFARRLRAESGSSWGGDRVAWRIVMLGVCASVPTAWIGLQFKEHFEAAFEKPVWISAGLSVTGTLLMLTVLVPRGRVGWKRFSWLGAALVGVGQGLAILPGVSRSGTTICVASFFGLRRRWAAQFSFLIAIPAIIGAAAIKLKDTLELPPDQLADMPWGPILAGTAVAIVAGYLALTALLYVVRRAKLHYFALYCWLLAAVVLILLS